MKGAIVYLDFDEKELLNSIKGIYGITFHRYFSFPGPSKVIMRAISIKEKSLHPKIFTKYPSLEEKNQKSPEELVFRWESDTEEKKSSKKENNKKKKKDKNKK